MESESYTIRIQNSTHHNSNSIPNHADWDSTIDINQKQFRIQLSLESDSESFFDSDSRVWIAPGLNHFPVIIMLVCKINMFLKSDKHNSVVYLLSYFYVINFVWFSGYKKLLGNWNVLLIVLFESTIVLFESTRNVFKYISPKRNVLVLKYFRGGKYLYLYLSTDLSSLTDYPWVSRILAISQGSRPGDTMLTDICESHGMLWSGNTNFLHAD